MKKVKSGKVREIFDLGDRLLFVATDRISAFDCVMPNGIPRKGEVLTQMSYFWFDLLAGVTANHLAARATDPLPPELEKFSGVLAHRSMVVQKARPLAVECVVRGYLTGSGWKEYKKSQTVCGIKLPAGLTESAELPSRFSRRPPRPKPGTTKIFPSRRRARSPARNSPRRRAT